MATKAYTDLEQSKKLAKILPLESADCFWDYDDLQKYHRISWFEEGYDKDSQLRTNENNVCAWSLTALLGVVSEDVSLNSFKNGVWIAMVQHNGKMIYRDTHNPVDACYKLILNLHERNLL